MSKAMDHVAKWLDDSEKSRDIPLKEPLDLLHQSVGERIIVKMKDRVVRGILHAFDQHLNLVLGKVKETVTVIEIDDETYEEIYKKQRRRIPLLYVRGECVIMIAPPSNNAYAF